jgi:hypothetical protein
VEPTGATRAATITAFMQTFETGPASAFFRLWRAHLPPGLISSDSSDSINPRRLEFYLRVHFSVLPFRGGRASAVPTPRDVVEAGGESLQVGVWGVNQRPPRRPCPQPGKGFSSHPAVQKPVCVGCHALWWERGGGEGYMGNGVGPGLGVVCSKSPTPVTLLLLPRS